MEVCNVNTTVGYREGHHESLKIYKKEAEVSFNAWTICEYVDMALCEETVNMNLSVSRWKVS